VYIIYINYLLIVDASVFQWWQRSGLVLVGPSTEEVGVGVGGSSALDHEFVSDTFQAGDIDDAELQKEMHQLGMTNKLEESIDGNSYLLHYYLLQLIVFVIRTSLIIDIVWYYQWNLCDILASN